MWMVNKMVTSITATWALDQICALERDNKSLKEQLQRMNSLQEENSLLIEENDSLRSELSLQRKELESYRVASSLNKEQSFSDQEKVS